MYKAIWVWSGVDSYLIKGMDPMSMPELEIGFIVLPFPQVYNPVSLASMSVREIGAILPEDAEAKGQKPSKQGNQ